LSGKDTKKSPRPARRPSPSTRSCVARCSVQQPLFFPKKISRLAMIMGEYCDSDQGPGLNQQGEDGKSRPFPEPFMRGHRRGPRFEIRVDIRRFFRSFRDIRTFGRTCLRPVCSLAFCQFVESILCLDAFFHRIEAAVRLAFGAINPVGFLYAVER